MQPHQFTYHERVGAGALGIIRRCEFNHLEPEEVPEIADTPDTEPIKKHPFRRFLSQVTNDTDTEPLEASVSKPQAAKLLSKYHCLRQKHEQHLENEIKAILRFDHPFLLRLNAVAQDNRTVFLYSDFKSAGSLLDQLNVHRQMAPEVARFYVA